MCFHIYPLSNLNAIYMMTRLISTTTKKNDNVVVTNKVQLNIEFFYKPKLLLLHLLNVHCRYLYM